MSKRTNVVPKEMETIKQRFHYNLGVKAANLLFVAGQVGRDANLNVVEGKEAQFVQAFENLKKVFQLASFSTRLSHYPGWTATGACAGCFSVAQRLSFSARRSAPTTILSGPAQDSLALQP